MQENLWKMASERRTELGGTGKSYQMPGISTARLRQDPPVIAAGYGIVPVEVHTVRYG